MPKQREKLLVLGAGPLQVPLIQKGKDAGFHVYSVSYLPDDPGLKVADDGRLISILDFAAIERLCADEGIRRVVTCASDLATLALAHLSDALGLGGLTMEQVRSVSEKHRFVELQSRLELPIPEQVFHVRDLAELRRAVASIETFPVVMKPACASGSRGVVIAHCPNEVSEHHQHVISNSFMDAGYVIQTYLAGVEHGCECLVENGRVVFLQLTRKYTNDARVPLGHCVPFACSPDDHRDLVRQVQAVVDTLGVEHSPVNIDVFLRDGLPPVIIDLSFRLGGNLLPVLMGHAFGVDMFGRVILHTHKERLPPLTTRSPDATFGSIVFGAPREGELTQALVDRLRPVLEDGTSLCEFVIDVPVGSTIDAFTEGGHRFGHAVLEASNTYGYERVLEECCRIVAQDFAPARRPQE